MMRACKREGIGLARISRALRGNAVARQQYPWGCWRCLLNFLRSSIILSDLRGVCCNVMTNDSEKARGMASKEEKGVCLVIGAGDATGGAVARRFAREGYVTCVTRRSAAMRAKERK
jgi:hypothetical protein